MKFPAFLVAIFCMTATSAAVGQTSPERKAVTAKHAEKPPVLDGRLDDLVWQQASFVEDLHVVVSNEFGEPSERSRIYVAFDDDALYFAARFWDSKADGIIAKVLRKNDVSFGDDGFSITLDPFDQGRSGYAFDVNPNGMRSEGLYTDVDRQNWDWEGIWDAAARQDDEGWIAEVAIPLKSLSFDPARDAWGVNFTRWLGRDNEQFGWVSYNRTQDLQRLGLLEGLSGLQQGRGLDVIPGLRTGSSRDYVANVKDTFLEPSLDVFWKFTPSMTTALTLNPDFAGTTADARQVNLTRFELFFPEQRAFFLQDADKFEFGGIEEEDGLPFFSRRIGLDDDGVPLQLDAGLKLAGRAGPLTIGVLGVRQDSATSDGSENLFVGRIATNVLAESVLGAIVTSGNPDSSVDNSLVGADFRYLNTRLGEDRVLEATAWYQQTDTEGLDHDDTAYGVSVAMPNSRGWSGEVGYKRLEENYFPALGFASRTDVVDTEAEAGYRWRPKDSWIRSIYSGVEGQIVNAINGQDRTQEVDLMIAEIENQTADRLELEHSFVEERLMESFEISDGIVIPAGTYTFDHSCATIYTGEHRDVATETTVCEGGFYDGDIFVLATRTTWRPSPHWRLALGGEYNDVNLPQGDFITRLVKLNVDIAFNVAWSWENFFQYDNDSETIGINSILRWIPRAGREAVFAINSQLEDFDRNRSFQSYTSDMTLKLSYTFRF